MTIQRRQQDIRRLNRAREISAPPRNTRGPVPYALGYQGGRRYQPAVRVHQAVSETQHEGEEQEDHPRTVPWPIYPLLITPTSVAPGAEPHSIRLIRPN